MSVNVCESVPQTVQVKNMDKPNLTKLAAEAGLVNSIQKPNCFAFLAPEFEVVHVRRIHDGAKELEKPRFL